jgi:Ca-activated chloride channel family protein
MQMPLTTDHGAAKMYIQNAGPQVVPSQGTVIADALRMSNTAFNNKERKFKAIVLVTDGEDHDPDALPAAKVLAGNGVMVNTIGIGFPEGVPFIDPATNEYKKDPQGATVITRLNEPFLIQLASVTNGVYVRLDDVDEAVRQVMQQVGTIEKTALSDSALVNFKSYYQWFLGAAVFLLLLEFFLPERKFNVSG